MLQYHFEKQNTSFSKNKKKNMKILIKTIIYHGMAFLKKTTPDKYKIDVH